MNISDVSQGFIRLFVVSFVLVFVADMVLGFGHNVEVMLVAAFVMTALGFTLIFGTERGRGFYDELSGVGVDD